MKVTILDTDTGARRTTEPDFDFTDYWWAEGNGSCDCNREIVFGVDEEMDALLGENICHGARRFLIVEADGNQYSLEDLNADYPVELRRAHLPQVGA